eukprot:4807487-Amphidinium_carterae.2
MPPHKPAGRHAWKRMRHLRHSHIIMLLHNGQQVGAARGGQHMHKRFRMLKSHSAQAPGPGVRTSEEPRLVEMTSASDGISLQLAQISKQSTPASCTPPMFGVFDCLKRKVMQCLHSEDRDSPLRQHCVNLDRIMTLAKATVGTTR